MVPHAQNVKEFWNHDIVGHYFSQDNLPTNFLRLEQEQSLYSKYICKDGKFVKVFQMLKVQNFISLM